jgi:hypothetical protein
MSSSNWDDLWLERQKDGLDLQLHAERDLLARAADGPS